MLSRAVFTLFCLRDSVYTNKYFISRNSNLKIYVLFISANLDIQLGVVVAVDRVENFNMLLGAAAAKILSKRLRES